MSPNVKHQRARDGVKGNGTISLRALRCMR